jgi:predicted nucleic acid-binding protein
MTAAVDSSIILDVLLDDPGYVENSLSMLEEYLRKGAVIISPVAFSECAAALASPGDFKIVSQEMGLIYKPFTQEACALAAGLWRQYRVKGGSRQRILADFMIGAHAQTHADILLTRDRGFFRKYFQDIQVVTSGAGH